MRQRDILCFPALAVLIYGLRGLLIQGHRRRYVNFAMVFNLFLTAAVLFTGVPLRWPGLPVAALALNLAAAGELAYPAWRTQSILPFDFRLFG